MEEQIKEFKETAKDLKKTVNLWLGVMITIVLGQAVFIFTNTYKIGKIESVSSSNEEKVNILIEKAVSEDKFMYTVESLKILMNRFVAISEGDQDNYKKSIEDYERLEKMILSDEFGIKYRGSK